MSTTTIHSAHPVQGVRPPQLTPDRRTYADPAEPQLDTAKYWVGAGLTAVVAALAAVVGLVVVEGLVRVPVLAGGLTAGGLASYGLVSAVLAGAGGLLYFALLRVAPRPTLYYGWIVGLVTVLGVLLPFTTGAALAAQAALAGLNLVIGLTVLGLVPFAADSATS